jgi:hypothetical protein
MKDIKAFTRNKALYDGVLNGSVKPREIIGTGYRYPKSVAIAWLLRQLWANKFGSAPAELHVLTNGALFTDYKQANRSKVYNLLCKGGYERLDEMQISDFGIRPFPIAGIEGYVVYVNVSAKENKRIAA